MLKSIDWKGGVWEKYKKKIKYLSPIFRNIIYAIVKRGDCIHSLSINKRTDVGFDVYCKAML